MAKVEACEGSMVRTAVYNPGSHPALAWIAATLATQGNLAGYATALQLTSGQRGWADGLHLSAGLSARTLPPGLGATHLHRAGVVADLRAISARRRLDIVAERRWLTRRNVQVARRFAAVIGKGEPPRLAILPTNTNSGVHRQVRQTCNYGIYTPLPYIRELQRLMDAEGESNPRWSSYLQFRSTDTLDADANAEQEVEQAAVIVANSRFTASTYARGLRKPIVIAPLAVPPTLLARAAQTDHSSISRRGPLKLLFAGQISQRKGLSYLFGALDELASRNVSLTLVGSDPLGMFPELVHAHPRVRASYLGPMDQGSLWRLMRDHHALVFPSLAEGYGNVINEALANGLPVIASERTGAVDAGLHERAGLVVAAGSASALANAVDLLASAHGTLDEYAVRAPEVARTLGGWDVYGETVVSSLAAVMRDIEDWRAESCPI